MIDKVTAVLWYFVGFWGLHCIPMFSFSIEHGHFGGLGVLSTQNRHILAIFWLFADAFLESGTVLALDSSTFHTKYTQSFEDSKNLSKINCIFFRL